MSTSLNSTPISSPSAPSSLNCMSSAYSPTTTPGIVTNLDSSLSL
jgi:hypothetical protein